MLEVFVPHRRPLGALATLFATLLSATVTLMVAAQPSARTADARDELRYWVTQSMPGFENPVVRFFADASLFIFHQPDVVMRARRIEDNLFTGTPVRFELM